MDVFEITLSSEEKLSFKKKGTEGSDFCSNAKSLGEWCLECLCPPDFLRDFSNSYTSYTKSKAQLDPGEYVVGLPGWPCNSGFAMCTG